MRVRWAVVVGMVAGLAGCAGAAPGGGPTGAVHGTITMVGGPPEASPFVAAGTVVASRGGHEVTRQDVPQGQEFRFNLAPGTYQLSVRGATAPCLDVTVTLAAGDDRSVTLICSRK